MRAGFLGKGGSGKTTLAAGYAKWLAAGGRGVLAVDADVNVHLGGALGMDSKNIGYRFADMVADLEPARPGREMFIGATPPCMNSAFIRPTADDPFLKKYATRKDGISLLSVGTYDGNHAGSECYHSLLGAAEFIGGRLLDGADDRVVFDMTAGIDSIGTGMFFIADMNIFIVEPTKKSIDVYTDFKSKIGGLGAKTVAALNKIESKEDEDFIRRHIPGSEIIAVFPKSDHIRSFEQGDAGAFGLFVSENAARFAEIDSVLGGLEKDWAGYYEKLLKIYKDNCETWYNGFYGRDLAEFIDDDFSYDKVLGKC